MDQNCHVPVALSSFVTCTNMLQDWRDQEAQVTSRGLSTHDSLSPSPWCYLIPLAPGFIWPESIVTGVTLCRKLFLLGYGRQLHLSSLLAGVSLFTVCNGERGKRPVSNNCTVASISSQCPRFYQPGRLWNSTARPSHWAPVSVSASLCLWLHECTHYSTQVCV